MSNFINISKFPKGGTSQKMSIEQSFSDPNLNEWLEIMISTPKQGNSDQFWPLNAWNDYPNISLFWLFQTQKLVSFILVSYLCD